MKRRILYSNNGVLSDLSVALDNYQTGTSTIAGFVAAEDYIFIGSELPFNHLYLKLDGVNVNSDASVMSVSYWDSTQFRSAVDLLDETATAGASLAQSGFASWSSHKTYGWVREDTNYGGNSVTGLETVDIYNMYWLRIGFSADLTAGLALSWVGQKFSNDADLGAEHSDLVRASFIDAYQSGKTDWEEQHVLAANLVIDELIHKKIVFKGSQLLDKDDLKLVTVKKVAEIIYGGMGRDYNDERDSVQKEYYRRINKALPTVDRNINGRKDINETVTTVGRLYR